MKYNNTNSYIIVLICKNMFKYLKEKVLSSITAHPKLVTFGIGLVITFVIGTAIGMVEHNQALGFLNNNENGHDHNP
jgi:quinol-cytochrome oxidoreductase complex cytochrome b subunit